MIVLYGNYGTMGQTGNPYLRPGQIPPGLKVQAAKPAAKSAAKPAAKPKAKPAAKPAAKPVSKSVAKAAIKQAVAKTIVTPHPTKPGVTVKITKKPEKMPSVPLVKIPVNKPMTTRTIKKKITAAAKKTVAKAQAASPTKILPTKDLMKQAEEKLQKWVEQNKPSIIPDLPQPAPVPAPAPAPEPAQKAAGKKTNTMPILIGAAAVVGVLLLAGKR